MFEITLYHSRGETKVHADVNSHEEAYKTLFELAEKNNGWVNSGDDITYTKTRLSDVTYIECVDLEKQKELLGDNLDFVSQLL